MGKNDPTNIGGRPEHELTDKQTAEKELEDAVKIDKAASSELAKAGTKSAPMATGSTETKEK